MYSKNAVRASSSAFIETLEFASTLSASLDEERGVERSSLSLPTFAIALAAESRSTLLLTRTQPFFYSDLKAQHLSPSQPTNQPSSGHNVTSHQSIFRLVKKLILA